MLFISAVWSLVASARRRLMRERKKRIGQALGRAA
jgi:hypothetical protein